MRATGVPTGVAHSPIKPLRYQRFNFHPQFKFKGLPDGIHPDIYLLFVGYYLNQAQKWRKILIIVLTTLIVVVTITVIDPAGFLRYRTYRQAGITQGGGVRQAAVN
jgi:hypothetical protein